MRPDRCCIGIAVPCSDCPSPAHTSPLTGSATTLSRGQELCYGNEMIRFVWRLSLTSCCIAILAGYLLAWWEQVALFLRFLPFFLLACAGMPLLLWGSTLRKLWKRRVSIRSRCSALMWIVLPWLGLCFFFTYLPTPSTARSTAAVLKSLPYLATVEDGAPDAARSGVLLHDPVRSVPGVNLYCGCGLRGAYLVNGRGQLLHRWLPRDVGWDWHHIEPLGPGELLVVVKDQELVRLDKNAKVLWRRTLRAHHDVAVEGDQVHLLSRRDAILFRWGLPVPVLLEQIITLDLADGTVLRNLELRHLTASTLNLHKVVNLYAWSLSGEYPRTQHQPPKERGYLLSEGGPADLLHLNSLELVTSATGPFKTGDFLLGAHSIDEILVVDRLTGFPRWRWGEGHLENPHHPTLLPNGQLLLYDNGTRRGSSRVLQLEPSTGVIVWTYPGSDAPPFFSSWGGANQRLSGGTTLITDSQHGRAFEVTPEGTMVWDFFNPQRLKDGGRETIYRLHRLEDPRWTLPLHW